MSAEVYLFPNAPYMREPGSDSASEPQEIIVQQVIERIVTDRECDLRKALIDLGWTPPPENQQ